MRNKSKGNGWDFTPVIDLIHSLAVPHDAAVTPSLARETNEQRGLESGVIDIAAVSLGDFGRLWDFLGTDGIPLPTTKGVRWQDEISESGLVIEGLADQDIFTTSTIHEVGAKVPLPLPSNGTSNVDDTTKENDIQDRSSERRLIISEILARPLPLHDAETKSKQTLVHTSWPVARPGLLSQTYPDPSISSFTSRKAKLHKMLMENFAECRPLLMNLPEKQINHPQGLHVFVDASNIVIGFHDALKVSRALSPTTRLRRQPISFHSLSMILCRGRPTAKRVVVGSDNFSEMVEAKQIGYETNILDRVHKVKEPTPRQRRHFSSSPLAARNGNGLGHVHAHGFTSSAQSGGSGSETPGPSMMPKWVEQAVDEILHLKMMESLVDAETPATMVLATGDAAAAEYSAGFLKMVERALVKGWKVELACWSQNMSSSYRRPDFRRKWVGQFRIIELDEYVELILGV